MFLLSIISLFLALLIYSLNRSYVKSLQKLVNNPASTEETSEEENVLTPLLDCDINKTEPRPYRPWKPGKFAMTMGIRKMPEDDWLLLDNRYIEEQKFRRYLLTEKRDKVMQHLPGTEEACAETLDMIVEFLTKRYPQYFVLDKEKPDYVQNRITDLTFRISEPYELHPLEVAAQLVMEDLNLLFEGAGADPEQHYLRASFTMAPAGWHLEERIGWPLWKIHTPAPLWEQKLRKSVEKNFLNMKPDSPVQRNNYFIQVMPSIFQQDPFPEEVDFEVTAKDIIIRHERQTLRRLPKSKAILFTVRSYFTPLTDLEDEPDSLRDLLGAAENMPESVAKYKARQLWYAPLKEYAGKVLSEKNENNGQDEMRDIDR